MKNLLKINGSQMEKKSASKGKWVVGLVLAVILAATGYFTYGINFTIFGVPNLRTYDSRLINLDIDSILIEAEDLPAGFSSSNIKDVTPSNEFSFTRAKEQQIFSTDNNLVGEVAVYLFSSQRERDRMFSFLSLVESQEGIIPYKATGIGECESCSPFATDYDVVFVFTRCAALSFLRLDLDYLGKGYDFDYLVAHAKRLDTQLKSLACEQP